MSIEVQESQDNFLRQGGCYQIGLAYLRKQGTIPRQGQTPYHEYPKMLRFSKGFQEFKRQTTTCDKEVVKWTENKEVFDDIIVYDEAEEERLLAGGKTSAQIEEERQTLLRRCASNNISADPSWTTVRLRRELGDALDAPPTDEMGALTAKLAQLKQMAAMRAEIAALEAQLAGVPADDPEEMRAALTGLGVKVDGRWSVTRLREELDRGNRSGGRMMTPLEILEQGHKEAEQALVDLKALWEREDETTAANRAAVLEAHAQGARDRDAVRVTMGGASLIEAEKAAEAEKQAKADADKKPAEEKAAAERRAESEAATRRTSELPPPQPLQALQPPAPMPLKP